MRKRFLCPPPRCLEVICPCEFRPPVRFLIFVSGLLGPVLGILITDYYLIRKKEVELAELYKENGIYSYNETGFNKVAMIALLIGVFLALIGYWVPALNFLYSLSWFTGFFISSLIYYFLMKRS